MSKTNRWARTYERNGWTTNALVPSPPVAGLLGRGHHVQCVRADDNPLVDKVNSTWRAQDDQTVEQITANVAKVAHFVPRTWGVARGIDQSEYVFLSWTWHRDHRSLEEYVIAWKVTPDGTISSSISVLSSCFLSCLVEDGDGWKSDMTTLGFRLHARPAISSLRGAQPLLV